MTVDGLNALRLEYNLLNLTSAARDMSDNLLAEYRWLADGTKTGVKDAAGLQGFEYVGSLVYKYVNGELQLESAAFGGGRIEVSEGSDGNIYTPNYYITDHLGSTRAILTLDLTNGGYTVSERSNFMPFGTRWDNAQAANSRYQFSGKEDQTIGGLPYQDFGARFYGGKLPIWTTSDPLSEDYYPISPYAYTLNNPIRFIDPNGMSVYEIDEDGNMRLVYESDELNYLFLIDRNGDRVWDENGYMVGIHVDDGSILDNLANGTKPERKYSDSKSDERKAETGIEGLDDMVSMFKFAADNTNIEWSISSGNVDGETKIGITTLGRSRSTERAFEDSETKAAIHSHSASELGIGEQGEIHSMGTDADRSNQRQYGQYIYMPSSGNLWQVKGGAIYRPPYQGTQVQMRKLLRR